MFIDYSYVEERARYTLMQTPVLDPTDEDNRYINNIWVQYHIPGPPYPCLIINIDERAEAHRTLGYSPWIDLSIMIEVVCGLPSDQSCSALLTALGYDSITTGEQSKEEVQLIVRTIENWLRGDETPDGRQRRRLYMQDYAAAVIPPFFIPRVRFRREPYENTQLVVASINLVARNIRLL